MTPLRVGMVIRMAAWPLDDSLAITAIGRDNLLGADPGGYEDIWPLLGPWVVVSEPYEDAF